MRKSSRQKLRFHMHLEARGGWGRRSDGAASFEIHTWKTRNNMQIADAGQKETLRIAYLLPFLFGARIVRRLVLNFKSDVCLFLLFSNDRHQNLEFRTWTSKTGSTSMGFLFGLGRLQNANTPNIIFLF